MDRNPLDVLTGHVLGLDFETIPDRVIRHAKAVISHDLAVAMLGSHTEEAGRAVDFAASTGNSGPSTVIGHRRTLAPIDAAFANAVIVRSLRQEDSILPSFIHAGPLVIPPALAIGEARRRSGREVITAVVAAYNVLGALAGTAWTWERCARTPSHVYGAFGAAAVSARLMGLDADQTRRALAYAGNYGAMITYGFHNHQYGVLARNGMTAAELGRARAPYREDALEGPNGFFEAQVGGVRADLDDDLAGIGDRWEVTTAVLKPYPCTAINVAPITLLEQLLRREGLPPEEVAQVTVRRSRESFRVPGINDPDPLTTEFGLVSSLRFNLAAVLLEGSVTPRSHRDPGLAEGAARLAGKIRIEPADSTDLLHHEVVLITTDGRRFRVAGGAEVLPVPRPAGIARMYPGSDAGAARIDTMAAEVDRLDSAEGVGRLMRCVA